MIELNDDDGTIAIDFPNPTGKVILRPPKYGAYRRLQGERQRAMAEMTEQIAALPPLEELPKDSDAETPEQLEANQKARQRLGPIYQERVLEVQDLQVDALRKVWKLILIGTAGENGDFASLATPPPPDDPDEWPIELLVDAGDLVVVGGKLTRTNPTVIDTVLRHWGKAHFRSGPTAPQPTL